MGTIDRTAPPASSIRMLLRIADVLVASLTAIAFVLAMVLRPRGACGTGFAEDPSVAFTIFSYAGAFGFAAAAMLAVVCRRRIATRIAGFLGYGLLAVPALITMVFASSPCALY